MRIEERLREIFDGQRNAGPASEQEITAAEAELENTFPPSYRTFLRMFGASAFHAPYSIAGLGFDATSDLPPEWESVIIANRQLRRVGQERSLLYFTSDGFDCKLYLDTTNESDNREYPVVALGPGLDGVIVAPSFLDFVERAAIADPLPTNG